MICDPRYNRNIGAQANKNNDHNDVASSPAARLLRLRELKEVYHPPQMHRAIFKSAAKQYLEMTRQQTQIKLKIKNKFRAWQVTQLGAQQVYHLRHREKFLKQLNHPDLVGQFSILYELLQSAQQAQRQSLQQLCQLGKRYNEIQQFLKIPGVGPITAHLFDAYIQDPHRFATKQKLWRYAQLGIVDRSSNGKPLGYRRLDRNGNSLLKHISYQIWKASLQTKQPNEVRDYFQCSLNTTGNRIHARLNTQRKILAVMWTVWKHQQAYQAQKFIAAAQPELVTRTQPS
ncbi:MAG: transposase [Verrucomicrobiia bacterium]